MCFHPSSFLQVFIGNYWIYAQLVISTCLDNFFHFEV